jgi:uncharacterized protein (TIRG00374 family)
LQLAAGVGVSGIGIFFAFQGVDVKTVMKGMWHAKLPFVIVAAFLYGLAFVFRSIRWRFLLKPMGTISLTRLFFALMFGFFVSEILPFRAGELARALLVAGWMSIPLTVCLGTIVAERLGDLFVLFTVCLGVSANLPGAKLPTKSLALTLTLAAICCALLIRWGTALCKIQLKNPWLQKTARALGHLIQGLRQIGNFKNALWLFLSSIAVWTFDLLAMNVLARGYGLSLSATGTGALIIGIAMGVMVPAAPGYIGTYEYFGKKTLQWVGVPTQVALTYVVSLHFFQMIMIAAFGLPALIHFGIPRLTSSVAKVAGPHKKK